MAGTRTRPVLPLYPWGVGLYKPPGGTHAKGSNPLALDRPYRKERASLAFSYLQKQLREQPCTHFALVIMRRPHRAAVGVLSPRRAPNLGKVHWHTCLRLIPLPGTSDVLLAPTMISHPLAYVVPNPQQSLFEKNWE